MELCVLTSMAFQCRVVDGKYGCANKEFKVFPADDRRAKMVTLETQDGNPILFHKEFNRIFTKHRNKHNGCLKFTKNGVTDGELFYMKELGFLGNINSFSEVILVTDKYVYTKDMDSSSAIIRSHEEIQRMIDMGGIVRG